MIDLSKYDLLQDRDNDESYTNGVWDLSYEVSNEKMEQEEIYNFLQEFKERVLAEKEQQILELQEQSIRDNQIYNEQLSEKEKEIEQYKETIKEWVGTKFVKLQNQKAIEQLEKVKDYFIEGYAVCKNFSDFYWNFTEQIDNQLEELKGE